MLWEENASGAVMSVEPDAFGFRTYLGHRFYSVGEDGKVIRGEIVWFECPDDVEPDAVVEG